MTTHDLKVHPQYFAALANGSKPFEARKDDRGYAVGDTLRLHEWDPDVYDWECAVLLFALPSSATLYEVFEELCAKAAEAAYTGRTLERRVTYVLRGGPWLRDGYVVLGLEDTEQVQAQSALLHEYGNLQGRHAILRIDRARIAAALGASADSDLVSLATTLATFYAAHAETVERQRDALREIAAWATEAYPVEQFPDQDMQRVASALADAGVSIGALHGQWTRHLTAGIGEIARKALEGGE